MGGYAGYSLFRETQGKLVVERFMLSHGLIHIDGTGQPTIILNRSDSLEEQVKTLIHELLHLSDENLKLLGERLDLGHPEEQRLEREMEQIYLSQPRLVDHLRKKISETTSTNYSR